MHTKHLSRYFTGSFTTAEFHRYGITSCYRFTSLSLSVLSIQSFQFILCFNDTVRDDFGTAYFLVTILPYHTVGITYHGSFIEALTIAELVDDFTILFSLCNQGSLHFGIGVQFSLFRFTTDLNGIVATDNQGFAFLGGCQFRFEFLDLTSYHYFTFYDLLGVTHCLFL